MNKSTEDNIKYAMSERRSRNDGYVSVQERALLLLTYTSYTELCP